MSSCVPTQTAGAGASTQRGPTQRKKENLGSSIYYVFHIYIYICLFQHIRAGKARGELPFLELPQSADDMRSMNVAPLAPCPSTWSVVSGVQHVGMPSLSEFLTRKPLGKQIDVIIF